MEEKGLSSTQFADGVEVPRAVVSHILSGRNKPSLDVILKIMAAHRDVSINWLLLGEGEMHSQKTTSPAADKLEEEVIPKKEKSAAPPEQEEEGLDNVQSVRKAHVSRKSGNPEAKVIERIVYFYTDKTFDTFTPA